MGPSGCGKTTLLNLLGDRVGSKGVQGTIALNGHKITKKSRRFIAYCTQDDIFFPQLTVKDTLDFTVSTAFNGLLRHCHTFNVIIISLFSKCNRLDYVFHVLCHGTIN
jgi:ABC-type uncharacterized transport system YnjBCD ATPase subunit